MKKATYDREGVLRVISEIADEIQQELDAKHQQDTTMQDGFRVHKQTYTRGFTEGKWSVSKLQGRLAKKGYEYTRDDVSAALAEAGVRPKEHRSKGKSQKRGTPVKPESDPNGKGNTGTSAAAE